MMQMSEKDMSPGEKIKKLRIEKSMTQSELAGDFITRNMLSLIESGNAQPSLQTIIYLAGRLNVPVGILVSDSDDEYFYRRMIAMDNIRSAFSTKAYKICMDLCDGSFEEKKDDEIQLIQAECCLAIGKEEFSAGRLKSACFYFDSACEHSFNTAYNSIHIRAESKVYCLYMREISGSLYSECIEYDAPAGMSDGDAFCRYAKLLFQLKNASMHEKSFNFVDNESHSDVFSLHIKAVLQMTERDYVGARYTIQKILNGSDEVQAPVMYSLFRDLEICCRESGDFKGAYEYSGAKVAMLEKLLTDSGL